MKRRLQPRRRIETGGYARIEDELAQILSELGVEPTPDMKRPPKYRQFLAALYRRASYMALHGKSAYLAALYDVRTQKEPTRAHRALYEVYTDLHRFMTNVEIARKLGIGTNYLRGLIRVAEGKPVDPRHTKAPTAELMKRVRLLQKNPNDWNPALKPPQRRRPPKKDRSRWNPSLTSLKDFRLE